MKKANKMENSTAALHAEENTRGVAVLILAGLLIGFINGFFGGGGGMICVPILCVVLKMSAKESHATAILVILPLSVVSAVIYGFSGSWNFATGLPTAVGVIIGGIAGALLLKKLSNKVITVIFAGIMIFAGVRMLF